MMTMTHEQRTRWTHRHCRFAIANRLADVVCQRLAASGIKEIRGLHLLHIVLSAAEPYTRRLTDEERLLLLQSIVDVGEQLRGTTISLLDLRLRLPKLLHRLRIPLTFMRSREVSELVDEAIEVLHLKGRSVARPKQHRDLDWEAARSADPLRFQPVMPVAQEV